MLTLEDLAAYPQEELGALAAGLQARRVEVQPLRGGIWNPPDLAVEKFN